MSGARHLQNGKRDGEPELLRVDEVVADGATFVGGLVERVRDADENPNTAEDGPSGVAVVTLEDAVTRQLVIASLRKIGWFVLVVTLTNPRHGGKGDHEEDDTGDNTPDKRDFTNVKRVLVLEERDNGVHDPGEAGYRATRMNTAEVLEECGQANAPPERGPLHQKLVNCTHWSQGWN